VSPHQQIVKYSRHMKVLRGALKSASSSWSFEAYTDALIYADKKLKFWIAEVYGV